ncbi:MAG: LPS assembly lipoprotein LptE [Acidiferrobacterales bacterium]
MPDDLMTLRVRVVSSRVPGSSLQTELQQALVARAGVTLAVDDNGSAPTLNIYSEQSDSRAVSVDVDVKVSEFLLRYQVIFGVTDAAGKELVDRQTITLQRPFTFDKLNVLAKEREEQELRNQMRQEVVQAIIRRLASGAS